MIDKYEIFSEQTSNIESIMYMLEIVEKNHDADGLLARAERQAAAGGTWQYEATIRGYLLGLIGTISTTRQALDNLSTKLYENFNPEDFKTKIELSAQYQALAAENKKLQDRLGLFPQLGQLGIKTICDLATLAENIESESVKAALKEIRQQGA